MALDLSALDEDDSQVGTAAPGVLCRAPLSAFVEDPGNPRFERHPESFALLVQDIRERGILQPIVVRRLPDSKLMIRFGSRRYRAAQHLQLPDVPYVITEDERQFDDYAQVSENEKRQPLQPLELATFIERKRIAGEKKKVIATKLGLNPSSVTSLLALVQDPPSFILDLYHSRKCRSPQYLYELRRLWDSQPGLVEGRCAEAVEIDRRFIDSIGESSAISPTFSPAVAINGDAAHAGGDRGKGAGLKDRGAARGVAPRGTERVRGTPVDSAALSRLRAPQLQATYCGRKVIIEFTCAPAASGKIIVRDSVGELWEVPIQAIRLTMLCESNLEH